MGQRLHRRAGWSVMTAQTEVAELADHLVPAVPSGTARPVPRLSCRPCRHRHWATAVLGVGLVLVTLTMGAAMAKLHQDLTGLQAQVSAQNHNVTCADLNHIHLHVRNRIVRCTERGN